MEQDPGAGRLKVRWGGVGGLLHGGPVAKADLDEIAGKLWFNREPGPDAYVRFGVLLVLSVVIASGGVLNDSTATVIGAMIVAPLMTPIMAAALAVVAGDAAELWRSILLVAAGVAVAIGLSFLMGLIVPMVVNASTNSQVSGRVQPHLTDLVVALASGAAGAFALSRRNVSDALPGVAIAISLVPPLCVVGVTLANGDPAAARGAFILFLTNLLAILVAGGGLLAIMGYGGAAISGGSRDVRRRAVFVIVIATVLVSIPLAVTGAELARETTLDYQIRALSVQTINPAEAELASVSVSGSDVVITIESRQGLGLEPALKVAAAVHRQHPDLTVHVVTIPGQVVDVPAT